MSKQSNGLSKDLCPCESSSRYEDCCGLYHKSGGHAPTAEKLMRSRYTAYVMGNAQYLFRTWHANTRPTLQTLKESGPQTLIALKIVSKSAGGVDDQKGMVEFISSRYSPSLMGEIEQHKEKSLFTRVKGNWVYIDAI